MRILGLDVGRRRIGVAISDPSGTLARPLTTLTVSAADRVRSRLNLRSSYSLPKRTVSEKIVVGLPRHLDGKPTPQTGLVEQFISALRLCRCRLRPKTNG